MLKYHKIIILFIIISIWIEFNHTFAAGQNPCLDGDFWEQTVSFMNLFLNLLAWLWIPFATIAGKLMSNSMVYWEFINMDKVLYMLWNISRTFSNFLAAGLILYSIITGITSWEIDKNALMKKIMKIALGIIIANMSRFIVWAIVDISTIVTTTVSALPGTYFNADIVSKNTILSAIGKNELQKRIVFDTSADLCDSSKLITSSAISNINTQSPTDSQILDSVMPKGDSIAWPLLYIGSSVIKIQDFILNSNVTSSWIDNVMIIFIRLWMTVLFFIAILMLLVLNLFRILYLWFFIAFTPLLVLLYMGNDRWRADAKIEAFKDFSMKNIFKLIFAPVIISGLLSVAMIMIVLMQQVLQANNSYVKFSDGLLIENTKNNSIIWAEGIFQTDIKWSVIYDSIKNPLANTFSDLLMLWITLAILWWIIKAIQSYTKDGIAWWIVDSISKVSWNLLWSLPIIPIGWNKWIGLWSAKRALVWENWYGGILNNISNKFWKNDQWDRLNNRINEALWLPTELLTSQIRPLTDYAKKLKASSYSISSKEIDEFFTKYKEVGILDHYTKQKKPISISSINGIKDTLPILLQKIYDNRNESSIQKKYGTTLSQLSEFKEWQSISDYIDKNYKSNKILFDNLYQNITGQSVNLSSTSPWKDFREKNIIPQ